MSSNFASGEGVELDFQSSQTYESSKLLIGSMNIGYAAINYKGFALIPSIGIVFTQKIYQDPILFDSYYMEKESTLLNYGMIIKYYFNDNIGVLIGVGNLEMTKISICYKFI